MYIAVYAFEILEMPKHNKIVDKSSSKQLKAQFPELHPLRPSRRSTR